MTLSREEFARLHDALLDAFGSQSDLTIMVRLELGENLNKMVSGGSLSEIVFKLIEWFDRRGRLDELVQGAHRHNPGNQLLRAYVEQSGQTSPSDNADVVTPVNTDVETPAGSERSAHPTRRLPTDGPTSPPLDEDEGTDATTGSGKTHPPEWPRVAGFIAGILTLTVLIAILLLEIPITVANKPILVSLLALGVALAFAFIGGDAAARGQLAIPILGGNPLQIALTGGVAAFVIVFILGTLFITASDPPISQFCVQVFVDDSLATDEERARLMLDNGIQGVYQEDGIFCFENVPNVGRARVQVTSPRLPAICSVDNVPTSLGLHEVRCDMSLMANTPDVEGENLATAQATPATVARSTVTALPTGTPTTVSPAPTAQVLSETPIRVHNADRLKLLEKLGPTRGNWAMDVAFSPVADLFGDFVDGAGLTLYDAQTFERRGLVPIGGGNFTFSTDGIWGVVARYAMSDGSQITELSRTQYVAVADYIGGGAGQGIQFVEFEENSSLTAIAALAGDTARVAVGGFVGAPVHVLEIVDFMRPPEPVTLRPFREGDTLQALAASPDGEMLAILLANGTEIWNVRERRQVQTLPTDWGWNIAYSTDGRKLALTANSGNPANSIVVYNVSDWSVDGRLAGHSDSIRDIDFSNDSSLLASVADDGTLRIWDVTDYALLKTIENPNAVKTVAFSNSDAILASAGAEGLFLWGIEEEGSQVSDDDQQLRNTFVISGVVETEPGDPVVGMQVSIYQWGSGSQQNSRDIVTDTKGHFATEVSQIGEWFIEPRISGIRNPLWLETNMPYIVAQRSSNVKLPDASYARIVFQEAEHTISGTVFYMDGRAADGITLDVIGPTSLESSSYPYSVARSRTDGAYEIFVTPGDWTIRAYDCGPPRCRFSDDVSVTVPPDTADLELRIPMAE